ncbi:MAG: 30S ribosome-binding factor RbfA [Legionella sp.]
MNNQYKRTDRVAEAILRKLTLVIQQEVIDPRLPRIVTISAVEVTRDLAHAKVYVTSLNDNPRETVDILNNAASYLRTGLAKAISTRTVPQLRFIYDESIEYAKNLSRLIHQVNTNDEDDSEG